MSSIYDTKEAVPVFRFDCKDKMSDSAHRISDLDEMIHLGGTFLRGKPIVDEMNDIHWKSQREKFQAAHEATYGLSRPRGGR